MTGVPTRADVDALFDADRPGARSWWVALWVGDRWRLVYDPPSPTHENRPPRKAKPRRRR